MSSLEFVLGSHLVSSAVLAAFALVVFALLQREIRVRPDAPWTGETVIGIAFAPLITIALFGAVVLGGVVMQNWATQPASMHELGAATAAALLAALAFILTAPRTERHAATRRTGVSRQTVTATG